MAGLFQRFKAKEVLEVPSEEPAPAYSSEFFEQHNSKEIGPEHILLAGAGLEILRDLQDKIEKLDQKLVQLEKTLEERMPGKVITEESFKQEIQDGDEFASKIISEVKKGFMELKNIAHSNRSLTDLVKTKIEEVEKPTLVEAKRMDDIIQLLRQHGKLTSVQLAQLLNMSRTRSNEYFKQMENLGIVESEILGKEKYYKLIQTNS